MSAKPKRRLHSAIARDESGGLVSVEYRDAVITVRCTQSERSDIERSAKRRKMQLSEYIRHAHRVCREAGK